MMPAPGVQGWQQPPPGQQYGYGQQQQYGYQQQQGQQQPPPPQNNWDATSGHESTTAHNDYPSPGEIHLTTKQYITRIAIALLTGIIIGGIIMFRLFPVFVRVVQAAATSIAYPLVEMGIWRLLLGW